MYFRIAQLLLEKPESELSILRARGCLQYLDDSAFMRSLASIQRFDVKRLGIKEKTVLVSVLFQYCGMIVTRGYILECDFPQSALKILQQTLDSSMQYFVETEPMQLARNVIDNISRNHETSNATSSAIPREAKPLRRAQSHFDTTTLSSDVKSMSQFVLDKFPNIRPVEAPSRRSFLGRRKSTNSDALHLSYSIEPIQKSVLTLPKNDEDMACELFKALIVVMGDRPIQSLTTRVLKNISDEYHVANELVSIGISTVSLRDELYIQLFKQLNRNTKYASRIRGWSLLAIYLHAFPPSQPFLPYVRAFITQSQSQDQSNMSTNSTMPKRNQDGTLLSKASDIDDRQNETNTTMINYSKKVLIWNEYEAMDPDGFHSDISMVDAALIADVIKRTPLQVEVSVLTGSVYQFMIAFGEIDSLFSILEFLLQKIVGPAYSRATFLKSSMDTHSQDQNFKGPEKFATRADLLSKLFRGFWFYTSDSMDDFHDTQSIPVQPDEASTIPWQHDFLWDMLQNNSGRVRRLLLRRRILLSSEELVTQLDLFKDMSAERDVIGTQRLWSKWLQEKTTDLPVDHARIDMLFAEETRYVNSQLYALSLEALIYLSALQLTLSLGEYFNGGHPRKWGGEHSLVMLNSDSSIRPSLNAINFTPNFPRNRAKSSLAGEGGIERRGSIERRASGLGSLFKGRSSVQSEVSEVDNDNEENQDREILWFGDVISRHDTKEMEILEEKLESLGISLPSDTFDEIVATMQDFQNMARHLNCSLTSQRFRYMMKSAYVTYVMAWPLAGGHFFEGFLDRDGRLEKILICLSGNGLHFLTIDEWLLLFQSPIYDIQSCTISSSSSYPNMSTESRLLNITVNEKILPIITTSALEIQTLVEAFSLEMLSRGSFPHGLEGGNDILDLGESYILASDSKAVMQRFLRNYPMLPTPPPPCSLERAPTYFDPPKSRRAILAEERAEEERIELEQARLAAESHAAKNLAHLEHGKQTLQKFMTEDDDDDDEGDVAAVNTDVPGKKSKKSRRRTGVATTESAENIRNNMITAAVCGVSNRPPLISLTIPPPPVRGVGMRLDSMFGGDSSCKPPKISSLATQPLSFPTIPPAAYKPKFNPPKNVYFPLEVEWSNNPILPPTSEFQYRLSSEDEEDQDIPINISEFYGSGYMCPEAIILPERSRQSSVVLYGRSSGGDGHEDGANSRGVSPASDISQGVEGEIDHENYFPLPTNLRELEIPDDVDDEGNEGQEGYY